RHSGTDLRERTGLLPGISTIRTAHVGVGWAAANPRLSRRTPLTARPALSSLQVKTKNDKRARLHLAAAFPGRGRIEIGRGEKDGVCLEVECHSACRLFGWNCGGDRKVVRRLSADNT